MTADVDATITDGQPPPAEHEIDEGLVRRLLEAQHPDLADRALRYVTDGWDNVTYRLGEDLAVRLPRRAVAAELFGNEQRWLPTLVHDDLWAAYGGITAPTHARARGWAIFFGTILLDTAVDGADSFGRIGRQTLERAVGGES